MKIDKHFEFVSNFSEFRKYIKFKIQIVQFKFYFEFGKLKKPPKLKMKIDKTIRKNFMFIQGFIRARGGWAFV